MPSSALGMLGGMFGAPQSGRQTINAPQGYLSNPNKRGSMMLEWLFGDPAAAERMNVPSIWSNFRPGPKVTMPGNGTGNGGGTTSPPPPAPTPWEYPDLYETPYLTTNWFGKT